MTTTLWDPHIQTSHLFLRPLSTDDLLAAHEVRRREEVYSVNSPDPPTLEQTRDWLATRHWPRKFNFAVLLVTPDTPKEEWPLIGLIGCPRSTPEVGYGLHADYLGRGLGTEALRAFLKLYWRFVPSPGKPANVEEDTWRGVEEPRPLLGVFDYAVVRTDVGNVASRKLAERCGFTFVGYADREESRPPGTEGDTAVYRLERPG